MVFATSSNSALTLITPGLVQSQNFLIFELSLEVLDISDGNWTIAYCNKLRLMAMKY
jgi:hypothetical protein